MEPFEVSIVETKEKWEFQEEGDAFGKFRELMEDADLCDKTIILKANPV